MSFIAALREVETALRKADFPKSGDGYWTLAVSPAVVSKIYREVSKQLPFPVEFEDVSTNDDIRPVLTIGDMRIVVSR